MPSLAFTLDYVLLFTIVLARVGGLVTFAPFWSHRAVPARARVLLAFVLAFVVAPLVVPRLSVPPTQTLSYAIVIMGEFAVGCVLGFVARAIFSSLELAAQIFGFQMGLSLAATIDPSTRAQTAALGIFAQMLGLLIFIAGDGHHWLFAATVRSFATTAPGTFAMTPALADLLLRVTADAFAAGVALAAPAIIVLVTTEIMLAVMGRAAPQLQIMLLGFPVKIAVGLWLFGACLYFLPDAVRHTLGGIRTALARTLAVM